MNPLHPNFQAAADLNATRRQLLMTSSWGLGTLALHSLLQADGLAAEPGAAGHSPLKISHFAPKAKSVIWMLMRGGVSHMESFDPKPALNQYAGISIPETPFA